MNDPISDGLESVLRSCAASAPEPLYPKLYTDNGGISRERLDSNLEKLRLGGLVRLTPWEKDKGQGYELTPEGAELLQNPRELHRLREGKLPPRPAPSPNPASVNGAPMTAYERGEMVREALLNEPNPVVGRALFALNILVFAFGLFLATRENLEISYYISSPGLFGGQVRNDPRAQVYMKVLAESGALDADHFAMGQWWRLITCCFVHIGLLHLVVNMLALYRGGPLIEQMWGHARFLWIYLLSGWGGSCLGLMVNPAVLLAGASGALCGIFAAQALWIILYRNTLPTQLLSAWYRVMGINLVLIVFISLIPGVSGAAHLGGAIVGVVTGLLLHVHRFSKPIWGWLALIGTLVLPAVGLASVTYEYYGAGKAKKQLAEARQADKETFLVLERFVLPVLVKPLPRVLPNEPDDSEKDHVELHQVVERFSEARAKLAADTDQLEKHGFLSVVFWPTEDKAAFDEVFDRSAQYALIDLYLHTEGDVRVVFDQDAKFWIMRHPSRREPPEAVKKTINDLAQEREKLATIGDRFAKAGPYAKQRTEKIRMAVEKLVKAWGSLLENTEVYLKEELNYEEELNRRVRHINFLRRHVAELCMSERQS
jgi:membrane associated rhomboid family serine protease